MRKNFLWEDASNRWVPKALEDNCAGFENRSMDLQNKENKFIKNYQSTKMKA